MQEIKSKILSDLSIKHGFITNFLNFHQDLSNSEIKKNYQQIEQNINCEIMTMNQCHSNIVEIVENETTFSIKNNDYDSKKLTKCDGLITTKANQALLIRTADCVPILITNNNKDFIGVVHSGREGTLIEINESMIKAASDMNFKASDLIVIIGPSIFQQDYEVNEEIYNQFISKNPDYKRFFIPSVNNNFLYDNRSCVEFIYQNSGIENIEKIKINTYTDKRFFSYRGEQHSVPNKKGRFASYIAL